MFFRHATFNKAAQLKRSVFVSFLWVRVPSNGKSQLEVSSSKPSLDLHKCVQIFQNNWSCTIALANCSYCKAPVCKNLPKFALFLSQFFLLSPTTRQIMLADSQDFWFVLSMLSPWFLLLIFICFISRCQKLRATGVFKSSKSFLK